MRQYNMCVPLWLIISNQSDMAHGKWNGSFTPVMTDRYLRLTSDQARVVRPECSGFTKGTVGRRNGMHIIAGLIAARLLAGAQWKGLSAALQAPARPT
ncbi:hypothetical protein NPIL_357471 [Nephila pilipes]|uniref:Uncharacterized protein n=1 Tax=Nephila pilipes TaxID=299642 RepID=A0A8X6Q905_NEPPI|nr:hypothetical protein NPIL_357471 [Nephila pilipes]